MSCPIDFTWTVNAYFPYLSLNIFCGHRQYFTDAFRWAQVIWKPEHSDGAHVLGLLSWDCIWTNTYTWCCLTKSANWRSLAYSSIIRIRSWISCHESGKVKERAKKIDSYITKGTDLSAPFLLLLLDV